MAKVQIITNAPDRIVRVVCDHPKHWPQIEKWCTSGSDKWERQVVRLSPDELRQIAKIIEEDQKGQP